MDRRTTKKTAFSVIGIACRTTNVNGKVIDDIPPLWERFMNENLLDKIPKRINQGIYCVYTNYESDEQGAYSVIVGAESIADANTPLPEGMVRCDVPTSKYLCLPVKGDYPDSLICTWEWVWQQSNLPRRYTADFEYYPEGMTNPKEPKLDVYIAVKEAQ